MKAESKDVLAKNVEHLTCVKCHKGQLQEHALPKSGVVIDQCNACGGMWFDANEFATILGPNAVKPFYISYSSHFNDDYQCPRCAVALAAFNYTGTSTEIDACPKCKGIWLDYKEWQEISAARKGK